MKKEIKKELEVLAPELINTGNRTPFLVPEDYWKQLDMDVCRATGITQDLTTVPNNYFDTLTDRVLIQAKEQNESKVISINYKSWIAAASVVAMFFAGYIMLNDSGQVSAADEFVMDVDIEEAFDFLDEEGLFLYDVLSIVDEEILSEIESDEIYLEESFEEVIEDLDDDQLEELF